MPISPDQHARLLALGNDGHVSNHDVLTLRREIFPDGVVDRTELELVFALGERVQDGDPSWPQLFAEVCADYFLNEEQPEGYLTDEEFGYLESLVTCDGKHASALELHALAHLMTQARQVPATMARFMKDQLVALVAARPMASIQAADLPLIRSVIYAGGGAKSFGISREEADFLFDLQESTTKVDNADAWRELFVKAVSAHLMQHVGYQPVAREEALRQQTWLNTTTVQPGQFMRSMVSGGLSNILDAFRREDEWTLRNATDAAAEQHAKNVCGEETLWLANRIGRDGVVDDAERALILYMRDHLNAALPERLLAMVEKPSDTAAA